MMHPHCATRRHPTWSNMQSASRLLWLFLLVVSRLGVADDSHRAALSSPALDVWHPRYASGHVTCAGFAEEVLYAFAAGGYANRSVDGLSWRAVYTGQTNVLRGMVYAQGTIVAVGEGGTITTSTNGIDWTARTSGTRSDLYAAAFLNGVFVVVGNEASVLTSTDGSRWQKQDPGIQDNLRGIVTAGQKFVAISRGGASLTSVDGRSWQVHPGASAFRLYGLAYGAGHYVAVGTNGVVVSSTDGIQWTQRRAGGAVLWSVAFGDGHFVAAGLPPVADDSSILWSDDGVTWKPSSPVSPHFHWCVAYGGGRFVVGGTSGGLRVSSHANEWQESWLPGAGTMTGALFVKDRFVVLGRSGAYSSVDGVDWRIHPIGTPPEVRRAGWDFWPTRGLAYGAGTFVAARAPGMVSLSRDLANWTTCELGATNAISTVQWLDDRFYALGSAGYLATSEEGVHWTELRSHADDALFGIAKGNGIFVAVGRGIGGRSSILTSTDGLAWTRARVADSMTSSFAYGNGKFVIPGMNGILVTEDVKSFASQRPPHRFRDIFFENGMFLAFGGPRLSASADGGEWVTHTGPSENLGGGTFGNGTFLLTGMWGQIYQSDPMPVTPASVVVKSPEASSGPDPAASPWQPLDSWQLRHSTVEANKNLLRVAYGAGLYAAIDEDGMLCTSSDGVSWRARALSSTLRLSNVRWINGAFFAVGEGGFIAMSRDGLNWSTAAVGLHARLNDLTQGNGIYVAVGDDGLLLRSADGSTWTEQATPVRRKLNAVTFDQDLFVAVGDSGTVLTSATGSDWRSEFARTMEDLVAVAGGNGAFYAVGANETWVGRWHSYELVLNWRGSDTLMERWYRDGAFEWPISAVVGVPGLTRGQRVPLDRSYLVCFGGQWYSGGAGFEEVASITGDFDQATSVRHSQREAPTALRSAAVCGDSVVGVGGRGLIGLQGKVVADVPQAAHLRGVATDGRVCVAVGRAGVILTSTNGFSWQTADSGVLTPLQKVAHASWGFVAVGDAGVILISSDGEQWSPSLSGVTNHLTAVVAGKGVCVAAGEGGVLLHSADGRRWSLARVTTKQPMVHVAGLAAGAGAFVATTGYGMLFSGDGLNWSETSEPVAAGRVTFGTSGFLGVAGAGIVTSTDARRWSRSPCQLPPGGIRALRCEAGVYVATGSFGRLSSSVDGVHWVERPAKSAWELHDVVAFRNSLIAVGDYGTILQSAPLADAPPEIYEHPLSQARFAGRDQVLEAKVFGKPPLGYQWRLNGKPIPGANGSSLRLTGGLAMTGSYDLVVSNRHGAVISEPAVVGDQSPPLPATLGARLADGGALILTISGSAGRSYRVEHADELQPGATWQVIQTVLLSSGPVELPLSYAAAAPLGFFRAVALP